MIKAKIKFKKKDLTTIIVNRTGLKRLFITEINKNWINIKSALMRLYNSGQSAVMGFKKWQKYSKSYRSALDKGYYSPKNARPVNLQLTGDMMKSLSIGSGSDNVIIYFDDDKAEYHQEGTDKMPQRQLLPKTGEDFKPSVFKYIKQAAGKAVADLIRRNLKG